jgi:hypothetical protein
MSYKIVEAAQNNIKEIVKVFKIVQANGTSGTGLPVGGTIGQMLRKTSSVVDYASEWFDLFSQVANFFNYTAPKTSLAPANGATATVDVSTNYDYTIAPSGASFTLELTNIPADGTAWSVTKDRIIARGNEGSAGAKEFYNLPKDMQ